jgi:hypothetical protein
MSPKSTVSIEVAQSVRDFYANLSTTNNNVEESRRLLETENHVESQSAKLNNIGEAIAYDVTKMDVLVNKIELYAKERGETEQANMTAVMDDMNALHSQVAERIQEYSATLTQLKTYNTRLNVQTTINIPRVDIAVNKYNRIIADISAYTKGGSFRVDRQNVTNSAISRKSDVYIYAIWILLTVIFAFLAVRVAYKGL